jgi:hypothetical protein
MIDRILQGSNPTIKVTVTAGTTPVDPSPDTAVVQLTRADGTILLPDTAATEAGTGVFTYQLNGTQTALLDTLVARWKFTYGGLVQALYTYHEIVGGFLCPLSVLASLYPDDTDEQLADKRTQIEVRLEDALGYAAVPRYVRETVIPHRLVAFLTWKYLRTIREVHDDISGVAWAPDTIAGIRYNPSTSKLYWIPSYGMPGQRTTIGYEHGLDYAGADVQRAMFLLAQEMYGTTNGTIDARVVRREADGQAITYAKPNLDNDLFSTPELNTIVRGSRGVLVR